LKLPFSTTVVSMAAPVAAVAAQILNVRYGLRNRLKNTAHHNSESSVPAADISPEKEPEIHALIKTLSAEIAADPSLILNDSYTEEERAADWKALVAKKTTLTGLDSRSRPGHKLLDHYMTHFWDVQNYKGTSVRSLCTQPALEKALHANLRMHSTPYKSEIRRALVMTGGLGNVTKYRALTTKAIVATLVSAAPGPKDFAVPTAVLDPCAGWGGRMLGVLAAGGTYTAAEPDPRTYRGLVNILEDPAIPADVKERATIYNAPAESILPTLPVASFDLVITSPPYYNLELYTDGAQSTVAHPSWDNWVAHWLRPVILGALAALKPETGVSCWSVKNFRSDRVYPLADTVKQIHADAGWRLAETVSVTGSGRPGAARIQDGKETRVSEEETYCFRKVFTVS
jgi:hypothetical protein